MRVSGFHLVKAWGSQTPQQPKTQALCWFDLVKSQKLAKSTGVLLKSHFIVPLFVALFYPMTFPFVPG